MIHDLFCSTKGGTFYSIARTGDLYICEMSAWFHLPAKENYFLLARQSFCIPQFNNAILTLSVCKKLKPNWQRTIPSEMADVHCSWYHHILKSLYSRTKVWRGEPSPAKMLIPPVSPENKTTNRGAANIVILLLLYL